MAMFDSQGTTYNNTVNQERAIADVITMIDPRDTPLLAKLGMDSARSKFRLGPDSTKIELIEDELDILTDAVGAGNWTNVVLTAMPVADASVFQPGHVILVNAELLVISAVDTAANTIAVFSRAYGGTNSAHTAADVIEIVGMARLEGADAYMGGMTDLTLPYNYTSIFQKGIQVSRTQRAISQYGVSDEFMYQSNKRMPHLLRLVEKMFFRGVRAAGSATTPRSAGGIDTFLSTNTVAAGGAITKADVDGLMLKCHLLGGFPDTLVLHPTVANTLHDILDNSNFLRVEMPNNRIGMDPIEMFVTQYGPIELMMDRFCPLETAYLLDTGKVGTYTLSPFMAKELSVVGDSTKGEVVGEMSLILGNEKAHGTITGLTA